MPAELKEIVPDPDRTLSEHLFPNLDQLRLDRIPRSDDISSLA